MLKNFSKGYLQIGIYVVNYGKKFNEATWGFDEKRRRPRSLKKRKRRDK